MLYLDLHGLVAVRRSLSFGCLLTLLRDVSISLKLSVQHSDGETWRRPYMHMQAMAIDFWCFTWHFYQYAVLVMKSVDRFAMLFWHRLHMQATTIDIWCLVAFVPSTVLTINDRFTCFDRCFLANLKLLKLHFNIVLHECSFQSNRKNAELYNMEDGYVMVQQDRKHLEMMF